MSADGLLHTGDKPLPQLLLMMIETDAFDNYQASMS